MSVLLDVTMSLDGFMAGPDVDVEHPMGVGGLRLHEWIFNASSNEVDAEIPAGRWRTRAPWCSADGLRYRVRRDTAPQP
ncbi:hypothetical protein [Micromonospora sp. NPDC007230]|uniref:hypothetical protein n=1 Tax=Micromonospora sp. NPDC007230 TaxID=3364237 RepID=UPI0036CE56E4